MRINRNTRITTLLAENQEAVIEALVKLNRNFSKLRNPVLRNLFARRISIEDACRIAHCKLTAFFKSMEEIGFGIDHEPGEELSDSPESMDFSQSENAPELDVRPYLDQNIDPLKEILKLSNSLKTGERFKIINSFEPVPLISFLREKGFSHQVEHPEENLVLTWFEKKEPVTVPSGVHPVSADKSVFLAVLDQFNPEKIRYIDVRQLEMPQPMIHIIEQLDELMDDELLYVHHKKLPVFLIPELTKRGWSFLFHQQSDQELDLLIHKL